MKEKNNMKKKAGKRFFKRLFHRKIVLFGTALVVLFVLLALAAPLVSPYDPYAVDPVHMWEKPSAEHWLGTDNVGRDVLSRMIYGSRTSLLIGLVAVALSAAVGIVLGLVSG